MRFGLQSHLANYSNTKTKVPYFLNSTLFFTKIFLCELTDVTFFWSLINSRRNQPSAADHLSCYLVRVLMKQKHDLCSGSRTKFVQNHDCMSTNSAQFVDFLKLVTEAVWSSCELQLCSETPTHQRHWEEIIE